MRTEQVVQFINGFYKKPFCWGELDCATFILDYLKFKTGKSYDHLPTFNWKNKKQAIKYAKKNKGVLETLRDLIDGEIISSDTLIKTGDIIVITNNGWSTAGIFINGRVALVVEDGGVRIEDFDTDQVALILRAY